MSFMTFQMSDNTVFRTVLFNQTRTGATLPQLSGHISIPVDMIPVLAELLSNQRTYEEQAGGMTIKTVRIPLSFWTAKGKAPLAYQGQSSFYTPQPQSEAPVVDKAPTLQEINF